MSSVEKLLSSLSGSDDTAYVLSRELKIVQVNSGFTRFALANGGESILARVQQQSVVESLAPVLREFFVSAFERAWATGERFDHDYECSSPETYRRFHMIAYPIKRELLVVVHSLHVERPHTERAGPADDLTYARDGMVKMCSHCRRVQNMKSVDRWDWVPSYLDKSLRNVSHGLCRACSAFYWPEQPNQFY